MKILNFKSKTSSVLSDESARKLTQDFLAGQTTLEQERTLYRYYSGSGIADDLEPYREMFRWYHDLEKDSKPGEEQPRWGRRRFIVVAASLAVLAVIGATLLLRPAPSSYEQIYAGSYIIRDGKKITDINQILPELQRADRYVDSTLNVHSVRYTADPEDALIREALASISDPEVRAMLLADIN